MAAKVEMDRDLSASDAARVIDAAQERLRAAMPTARVVYLEPDLPVAPPAAREP